ncbi:DUF2339 domain-containing protein, partial [bacterium]|nr:DUF2339 domain-containing protein [bacterium]
TLVAQFVFFAGGVFRYSVSNHSPLSKKEVWLFFPLLCFFYAITFNYVSMLGYKFEPNIGSFLADRIAPIYGLLFAGSLYALYYKAEAQLRSIDALSSKSMIQAFLCITLFHSGYLTLLPFGAKTWLLPASIVFYYIANEKGLKIQFPVKLLLASLAFFEWLSMVNSLLLEGAKNWNQIISGLSVLILGAIYYTRSSAAENQDSRKNLFLWGLHILAVSLSFRLVSDFGSLAVTGAWGVYAIAVLGLGYRNRDIGLSKSSTLILLAVAGKALLYDASHAASGVRIVCLLLTGLVLYGAGYLFKKISQWEMRGAP